MSDFEERVTQFFTEYAGEISFDGTWYTVSAIETNGVELEATGDTLLEAIAHFYQGVEEIDGKGEQS